RRRPRRESNAPRPANGILDEPPFTNVNININGLPVIDSIDTNTVVPPSSPLSSSPSHSRTSEGDKSVIPQGMDFGSEADGGSEYASESDFDDERSNSRSVSTTPSSRPSSSSLSPICASSSQNSSSNNPEDLSNPTDTTDSSTCTTLTLLTTQSKSNPRISHLLSRIHEYNWPIFDFVAATENRPLLVLAHHLTVTSGLLNRLMLPVDKFVNFMGVIEAGYHADLTCK
ncbi:hypothetical protein HK102_012214, partial [Quaeritorhiza haematococci]